MTTILLLPKYGGSAFWKHDLSEETFFVLITAAAFLVWRVRGVTQHFQHWWIFFIIIPHVGNSIVCSKFSLHFSFCIHLEAENWWEIIGMLESWKLQFSVIYTYLTFFILISVSGSLSIQPQWAMEVPQKCLPYAWLTAFPSLSPSHLLCRLPWLPMHGHRHLNELWSVPDDIWCHLYTTGIFLSRSSSSSGERTIGDDMEGAGGEQAEEVSEDAILRYPAGEKKNYPCKVLCQGKNVLIGMFTCHITWNSNMMAAASRSVWCYHHWPIMILQLQSGQVGLFSIKEDENTFG